MAKSLTNLSDAELITVANQVAIAVVTPSDYGTTGPALAALGAATTTFTNDVATQQSTQAAAKAATATKSASRDVLEDLLRSFRSTANGHGATEAQMTATGIPSGTSTPVPSNATIPVANIDTSNRFQHNISWAEATTPDNRKKPRGVMGADIYCKIDGPPPTDSSECNFVTTDSATPYLITYSAEETGKMAHYMLRWRSRDGSVGAWGETVSATITG